MRAPALLAVMLLAILFPAAAFGQGRSGSVKPAPLDQKLPAPDPPPKSATPGSVGSEAAPVPNRAYEGPVVIAPAEGPTLAPSVIERGLPSRGQATAGSPSKTEERLFDPAPGARLTVPFRY